MAARILNIIILVPTVSNPKPKSKHTANPNPDLYTLTLSVTPNHSPYSNPVANSDGISESAYQCAPLQSASTEYEQIPVTLSSRLRSQ